jgi:GxxExxY protein
MKEGVIYKDLSYKITGLLFEAHNKLGRYKSEKEYGDFIEILFKENKIPYQRECRVNSSIGDKIICRNISDFIIDNKIVLELKTVGFLNKIFYYQVKKYLSELGLKLSILVNFREEYLKPKRIINNELIEEKKEWYE